MKPKRVPILRERNARAWAWLPVFAALALFTGMARADAGGDRRLAAGPFAVLQGALKKTMFRVEVARVQIRVDPETQRKLAILTEGRKSSPALEAGAVQAVMHARDVLITSEVRHDIPFDRYRRAVYADLRAAHASGMVSEDAYWSVARLLPQWLRTLADRGVRNGDRFMCRLSPGSVRVLYRGAEGRTLVDARIPNGAAGRAVLASYLAPDSSFRQELLSSLFR